MIIDWRAMRKAWIETVKAELLPKLLADSRFKNGVKLTERFQREVDLWSMTANFRPVIHIGNELAAAECLLDSLHYDDRLLYEPPMAGTKKRIDFLKLNALGQHDWVEVKTVAPKWVDDEAGWQRFTKIAKEFPENAQLIVNREWAGAATAGQFIKTRWSFVQRTAEVEARAAFIPYARKGRVWLLFCSTGSDWCPHELEDFADFYRTGQPRADDSMSNAADRFMSDEGIVFSRSLAGFHYLGRKHEEVSAHCFRMSVAGPNFGA
jgi:hypothetical protein